MSWPPEIDCSAAVLDQIGGIKAGLSNGTPEPCECDRRDRDSARRAQDAESIARLECVGWRHEQRAEPPSRPLTDMKLALMGGRSGLPDVLDCMPDLQRLPSGRERWA